MKREKEYHPLMRYFAYTHLPPKLQKVSEPFSIMASGIQELLWVGEQDTAELEAGLRKLLEAKDCCVRAAL